MRVSTERSQELPREAGRRCIWGWWALNVPQPDPRASSWPPKLEREGKTEVHRPERGRDAGMTQSPVRASLPVPALQFSGQD